MTPKTRKITLKIPKSLKKILQIIESSGFEAFIVGGCVRDSLLGLSPKDWDITTNATPEQVMEIFAPHKRFKIFDIGLKHGTLGIYDRGSRILFEITTYRIDGEYSDFRRPSEIIFTTNLYDDLKRRDFSINALASKLL